MANEKKIYEKYINNDCLSKNFLNNLDIKKLRDANYLNNDKFVESILTGHGIYQYGENIKSLSISEIFCLLDLGKMYYPKISYNNFYRLIFEYLFTIELNIYEKIKFLNFIDTEHTFGLKDYEENTVYFNNHFGDKIMNLKLDIESYIINTADKKMYFEKKDDTFIVNYSIDTKPYIYSDFFKELEGYINCISYDHILKYKAPLIVQLKTKIKKDREIFINDLKDLFINNSNIIFNSAYMLIIIGALKEIADEYV